MTYEVPETAPRKKCEACGKRLALVTNPRTNRIVPVNVETGESHFTDCTDPARFSKTAQLAASKPRPLTGTQGQLL